MMQQGFVFFHAACNHQRHLLIAIECLQQHMEDQKNGLSIEDEKLPVEIMEQLVELSKAMTVDMENFTWALFRNNECLKSAQQFLAIERACHELLDANLSVVQTALDVAKRHGHAPCVTHELISISARTKLIRAQLCEYAGTSPPLLGLNEYNNPKLEGESIERKHAQIGSS